MRGREMHPLCCIAIDCAHWGGGGDQSPPPSQQSDTGCRDRDRDPNAAGVLCKWTNFGKGWRPRWFELRDGVLSYSKDGGIRGGDVRLIGDLDTARLWRGGRCRKRRKSGGRVVHLKVLSFRESRSDKKRFYIFSSTKTLHLKADSKKDCAAWIDALVSTRCAFSLRAVDDHTALIQGDVSFPTKKLRHRLLEEGVNDALIKDCEQIMLSEYSQLKLLYEEQFSLLALGQVEEGNLDSETVGVEDAHLLQNGFSSSWHGKYSEYSTTESSEDVERQELDELSAEDEPCFFDTRESFSGSVVENSSLTRNLNNIDDCENDNNCTCNLERIQFEAELPHREFPQIERRKRLPDPVEKEKGVSLWSIIKDNVGKDLTRVCLPVYFNEPLSSLQKCFEDLEYSYLLDRAYEYGRMGNDLMRILNVAAFAVSAYASSEGRPCKPFNPLLGETYEADFPEKGVRFLSEKVSHHPMLIACHCEGRGWKFWGDSNLRSKFWGRSIQLDPVGVLTLEFDDGEIFQWSKVTTSIYNLIFGKIYCDHHGTMHIQGNRQYSCRLKFKEQSILDRNPHQVQGFVENATGTKVANLTGKWDDSMYYVKRDDIPGTRESNSYQNGSLLWKRNEPPADPNRYNLSSFAITLNELTSDLLEKLPPTDSRRRPDQRHLENGEYEKANFEKQRLEKRQRLSRKLQESGWKPRWFHRDTEEGTFRYLGGYWEGRERKQWDGCLDIFGEVSENNTDTL